jgi:hypothetical protein
MMALTQEITVKLLAIVTLIIKTGRPDSFYTTLFWSKTLLFVQESHLDLLKSRTVSVEIFWYILLTQFSCFYQFTQLFGSLWLKQSRFGLNRGF